MRRRVLGLLPIAAACVNAGCLSASPSAEPGVRPPTDADCRDQPPVISIVDAAALRPFVGRVVTVNGVAHHDKDGVHLYGADVALRLPDEARDLFPGETERPITRTGRLALIAERHWHTSPNDADSAVPWTPIGRVQDRLSGWTPSQFRLGPVTP